MMPVFTHVMEILGYRQAKETRNPWGAPYMLSYPPPFPQPVALCPRPLSPSRHEGWGVRGTDAAALYSISLIRTGTTNKTGWCTKKKTLGRATAGSYNFTNVCLTCKLWSIWSCHHTWAKRFILKVMAGWRLQSLFILFVYMHHLL